MVEEGVVHGIDEELRRGGMRVHGAGHGQRAGEVLEAVVGFVLDRRTRGFLLQPGCKAAALDHEARNHAVEDRAAVETSLNVIQEITHRARRLVGVQLGLDDAEVGGDAHLRVGLGRIGGVGAEGQGEKGEQQEFFHCQLQ